MRWTEQKLVNIAIKWNVNEAMASNPSRKQRKDIKDACLTESSLGIWLEIGERKQPSRYIKTQPKPGQEDKELIKT